MRTDHRIPLQEFRTLADIEWSEPRWPASLRLAAKFLASGLLWAAVLIFALALRAALAGA